MWLSFSRRHDRQIVPHSVASAGESSTAESSYFVALLEEDRLVVCLTNVIGLKLKQFGLVNLTNITLVDMCLTNILIK